MAIPDQIRGSDDLDLSIDDGITYVDQHQNEVSPKLTQDGEELEPLAVTRLGGTLPWDTNSKQLQCNETVTDNGGDMDLRLVYEAVITHSQFKTLQEMRQNGSGIRLVSAAYTGPAQFDELKFDRVTDANSVLDSERGEVNEPIYTIQLQSKEDSGE